MAEPADHFVKTGLWTDESKGSILGQTLTVEIRTGTIIIALLTILASVAISELWNIFTFIYHQYRAGVEDADGLFWQQQALLRTLPTPTALMADTLKLSRAWRKQTPQYTLRNLSLFFAALIFAVAAIAAGISTPFAMENSKVEVLIQSPACGRINSTKIFAERRTSTLLASIEDTVNTYALNCYQGAHELPSACQNIFHSPNISFSVNPAPCPWKSRACLPSETPAIVMDSGLVDMKDDFGLNIRSEDSVEMQRRTTCNVLPMGSYLVMRSGTLGINFTTIEYNDTGIPQDPSEADVAFFRVSAMLDWYQRYSSEGYVLYSNSEKKTRAESAMLRSDADVAMLAIWLNAVSYEVPVKDPLFSAHRKVEYLGIGDLYFSDYPVGVIGCAEQYRYCVPQRDAPKFCTNFTGSPLEDFHLAFPGLKSIQVRILQLLQSISRLNNIRNGPSMKIILAQSKDDNGVLPGLPDNQWIKEVTHWEARVWASYQTLISAVITGPSIFDEHASDYTEPVLDDGDKQLCRSLKMRKAGGFANINVFALAFIVTISITITICNILMLRFLIFLSRFRAALAPRIDGWIQDGVYQLHRRALDVECQGLWVGLDKEIPVTATRHLWRPLSSNGSSSSDQIKKGAWRTKTEQSSAASSDIETKSEDIQSGSS